MEIIEKSIYEFLEMENGKEEIQKEMQKMKKLNEEFCKQKIHDLQLMRYINKLYQYSTTYNQYLYLRLINKRRNG